AALPRLRSNSNRFARVKRPYDGRTQQAKPKAQRLLTNGERVPGIQSGDGNYVGGFSKLYRVFFDGITPSSVVRAIQEMLRVPKTSNDTSYETVVPSKRGSSFESPCS